MTSKLEDDGLFLMVQDTIGEGAIPMLRSNVRSNVRSNTAAAILHTMRELNNAQTSCVLLVYEGTSAVMPK
uniref:Uncharacterized protein n=1 Tax=Peronospora matthiolae TaxID=2874970 RepID=A0AAV1UQ78_9STRA